MSRLTERIAALPRAARWALIGAACIGVYFILVEPALGAIERLNAKADGKAAVLEALSSRGSALRAASDTVRLGQRQFGEVLPPGEFGERGVALNQAVDSVMAKHGVTQYSSTSHVAPLGPGPLSSATPKTFRVERLMKEVQFEVNADQFAAVLADLERQPVVATVSRVQARLPETSQTGSRRVRATIVVEAWLKSPSGRK